MASTAALSKADGGLETAITARTTYHGLVSPPSVVGAGRLRSEQFLLMLLHDSLLCEFTDLLGFGLELHDPKLFQKVAFTKGFF